MPYTLNAGRVIVGPSGLKLAYLERNIPGAAGEDAISPTEADRLARQIVDALNAQAAKATTVETLTWALDSGNVENVKQAARECRDLLQGKESAARYCVGWNSPGYMPEGEPEGGYESWAEAIEGLTALIEDDAAEREESGDDPAEAIRAAKAGALDVLKMTPTAKELAEGVDVVFMGRAYFIRPDDSDPS